MGYLGERSALAALALLGFLLSFGCSRGTATSDGVCGDCPAGECMVDGQCRRLCARESDCRVCQWCVNGACVPDEGCTPQRPQALTACHDDAGLKIPDGEACSAPAGAAVGFVCVEGVCQESECGDGVVDARFEACDPGLEAAGCSDDCTPRECAVDADCQTETAEPCLDPSVCLAGQCSSATARDGVACTTDTVVRGMCRQGDCVESWCGDGVLDEAHGEQCDDGDLNSDTLADACRTTCVSFRCGDRVLDLGEGCDSTEGCGADCEPLPGFYCNRANECFMKGCENDADCGPNTECATWRCNVKTWSCQEDRQLGGTFCGEGSNHLCNHDGECVESQCGDGFVDAREPDPEACDPGSFPGTCNYDCTLLLCTSDADCEDGPPDPCLTPAECDESTGTCLQRQPSGASTCTLVFTGDGVCRDGDQGYACYLSVCGDDVIGQGEACDDGDAITNVCPYNSPGGVCTVCDDTCHFQERTDGAYCGDGAQDPEEDCDDGYTDPCGSCNASCSGDGTGHQCGDGDVCPQFEACDDGYADACGDCNANCTGPGTGYTCGDNVVCPQFEVCDDNNTSGGDGCSADCSYTEEGFDCPPEGGSCQPEPGLGCTSDPSAQPRCFPVVYVDASAAEGGDGMSWESAFRHLQDGLAAAQSGDEIWIAVGRYQPNWGAGRDEDDRDQTFVLRANVDIYGGFAGHEMTREARGGAPGDTVLTADYEDNDASYPWIAEGRYSRSENAYRVLEAVDLAPEITVDRFTIHGGAANADDGKGGGVYVSNSRILLRDCIFADNVAGRGSDTTTGGGAAYLLLGSVARFENCVFDSNYSQIAGGAVSNLGGTTIFEGCQFLSNRCDESGGALYGFTGATFEITNSHFEANRSTDREASTTYGRGGAISGAGSWRVADSTFMGNLAKFGGAISMSGSLDCDRCAFVGNQTITYDGTRKGGALRVSGHANVKLRNVLFSGNVAGYRSISGGFRYEGEGSAIYVAGSTLPTPIVTIIYGTFTGNMNGGQPDVTSVVYNSQSQVTLLNTILWNADHPEVVNVDGGVTAATYSCVEGGMDGEGNTDEDPGFLDPDGEDDLLGTLDDNPRLIPGSQAKDAGSDVYPPHSPPMTIDLGGEPRVVGLGPDMGAYEVQSM